ncbi:prepilin peptidase [bacterium]|nr:prepilin peptidase [bacterium]
MALLGIILMIMGFVFIVGLCIGSFLNVVILRALTNESIVFPGSKCPKCQHALKWYHNIPVLSYIFLRGQCAFCGCKISIQYPIVELFTGIMFVLIFLKFGLGLNALAMMIFTAIMIVLAGTDIKEKVVFDVHTYSLIILGLVYNFFNIGTFNVGIHLFNIAGHQLPISVSLIYSILGLIAGVIIMEVMARFGYLVAGARAFGEGDTFIAAGLGAIFGIRYLFTILILSIIIQVIAAIPQFIKKLYSKKDFVTLYTLGIFVVYVILLKWISFYVFPYYDIIYLILTLGLCAIGIYLCIRILKGLKVEENRTYLPFGPAMVFAAFLVMFDIPYLVSKLFM